MEQQVNKIECPNCGHEIDVNDLLYHQVNEELEKKYNDELAQVKKKYNEQLDSLSEQQAKLNEEKQKYEENLHQAIQTGVKAEKKKLEKDIKEKIQSEQSDQFESLQEELNEKSDQLKEFNKAKSEIERLKREKAEIKDQVEAKAEKKLNDHLIKEKGKIMKLADQKTELKLIERDKVIEQLTENLKEAQRKAEQGSIQAQGEAQELAIEEWLTDQFPLDTIEEIKKGARGADCIQIINTPTSQNCGSIYYESKRTKGFQNSWIEKFKGDIRNKNVDIGILVTEAMPSDMERTGQREGIWICTFDEFKVLSLVLRESIISLSTAVSTQENKGDKMNMLYDFLTSNEFRLQIEAIVEGFTQLQTDLESEKRSMTGIWKKREKQIKKVLENTIFMYSSIKGIAGNAIKTVKLLELPREDEDSPE